MEHVGGGVAPPLFWGINLSLFINQQTDSTTFLSVEG